MQIMIDIDDNRTAKEILKTLESYKKKGVKIITPITHDDNKNKSTDSVLPVATGNAPIQESFNKILGEYVRERANVSIGEDKRILQDALWERYGQ